MANFANLAGCSSLPFAEPPIAGESLNGLIVRNLAIHAVDRTAAALRVAGIETLTPERVATTPHGREEGIAALMRTDAAEIVRRMHLGSNGFVDFYGARLAASLYEIKRRRCSPRSLAAQPYHRDVWNLRPLSFCPETLETLIDRCPSCLHGLGWRWTLGPEACEGCGADLRDYPQPVLATDDDEALELAVGLVHPDAGRRVKARAKLPAVFNSVDEGDLFHLVLAFASVEESMRTSASVDQRSPRDATDLAAGGRVVLGWPNAFDDLAERTRTAMDCRALSRGYNREFGLYCRMRISKLLPDTVKSIVRAQATAAEGKLVGGRKLLAASGINQRFFYGLFGRKGQAQGKGRAKAAVLVDASKLDEVMGERGIAISTHEVVKTLGVGKAGVPRLAQAGLIVRAKGTAVQTFNRSEAVYDHASVMDLVTRVSAACRPFPSGVAQAKSLAKTVRGIWTLDPPWETVLAAVLDGTVSVGKVKASSSLTTSLVPHDPAMVLEVLEAAGLADREIVGSTDAARMLGTTKNVVGGAITAGLLKAEGEWAKVLKVGDVRAFKKTYVLTPEVAEALGCTVMKASRVMAAEGVKPAAKVAGKLLVWRRAEVSASIKCRRERRLNVMSARN